MLGSGVQRQDSVPFGIVRKSDNEKDFFNYYNNYRLCYEGI